MADINSQALRVPPDSTGKRIRITKFIEFSFSTMPVSLEPGDHIRLQRNSVSTGLHGFVIFVRLTGESGVMGMMFHTDHQSPSDGIVPGDVVQRQEAGLYVNRAVATSTDTIYYTNVNQLVSIDNPMFGQKVDQYGAAIVRFTEGGTTFDASGRLRQTNNLTIHANEFHDMLHDHYTYVTTDSGSNAFDSDKQCVILRTDGTPGVSGCVSDKYLYHEANATLFMDMAIAFSDEGKTNVVREWGLMDWEHNEGVFFRLTGSSLYSVVRSATSGVSVDKATIVSDWSLDTLGKGVLNPSKFKLDLTKVNSFWIELVQDGAGVARFGIFDKDNTRITCHIEQGNNVYSTGFMKTGSFPIHFHQIDSGGASTSEMFIWSATAEIEGPLIDIKGKFYEGCSDPQPVSSTGSWVPLFSVRPKLTTTDGELNHHVVMPKLISIDVIDDTDRATPVRIKLEVFKDAVLTGAVWAKTKGNTETDYLATLGNGLGATSMTGGTAIAEWIVRGNKDLDIGAMFDYVNTYLCNKANGTEQHTLTIAAKTLDPGVTANIVCALTWEEIESH